MKTAKIRILDEVNVAIVGLSDVHIDFFYDKYGILMQNYFFHPKYKLGAWDGKIRYFKKTGLTYLLLIDEIVPLLTSFGYQIEVEDKRQAPCANPELIDNTYFQHIDHPDTQQPTILRDVQVQTINAFLQFGFGIVIAATASGKTISCAAICDIYGKHGLRTITIVPTSDLIRQTKQIYAHYQLDVGEYSGTKKTLDHQHVVSTWQALQHNPSIMTTFSVVMVDECQGAKGKIIQTLLNQYGKNLAHRFGVTGTLPKGPDEQMSIKTAIGPVRCAINASHLIEQGVLSSVNISVLQLEEDFHQQYNDFISNPLNDRITYTQFKDNYLPDYAAEKHYVHANHIRNEWIVELIEQRRDSKKGNCLVIVDSVPHARRLARMIPRAKLVTGRDVKDPKKRKEIYNMFGNHDDLVLVATAQTIATGIDIQRIFFLFLLDFGKSFVRTIQAIGRGLRKGNDKDHVEVYDICSDLKYGKKHWRERKAYYDEAKYPYKRRKVAYNETVDIGQPIE